LIERITTDMFGPLTRGHEARYCLAAGFLRPGDVVVDAACGIAYGASVLCAHRDVSYIGVDKDVSEAVVVESSVVRLIEADLTTWRPEFEFDVAVGFETVEHLPDYSTYLEWCRQAHRFVLLSVPFVPTVGTNPFHVHDFERDELIELFLDEDWELFQYLDQPSELAGLYVFARNGVSPMSLTGSASTAADASGSKPGLRSRPQT
jgi:hypothetical protein